MTAAAADLQKALFSALTGDAALVSALGGAKVFDHAPAHAAFPYVTFGRTSVYDWSTGTESGAEQLLTLHVWSKARGRKETLDIMNKLARQDNIAVLFTEHDMDVVFAQADCIIVLNRGKLIAEGSPAEVRANPEVQAVYLGTGAVYAAEGH